MSLHFLRPEWFLALLLVAFMAFVFYRSKLHNRDWAAVIDAALLPHLLSESGRKSNRWWFWAVLSMSILVIIALAGPVWNKLPQPVFKQQSALVIALDLSQSMNAQDIKPSRLARARLKLIDILKMREEGQTALIAYAGTAYTVSPLTDDSDTIQSLVSSLSSELMPAQGSRSDLALQHAVELLNNAGQTHGDILFITDGISDKSASAIQGLDLKKIRVSILSVGSEQGAPIPMQSGGFVKDAAGSIVIAKTERSTLRRIVSNLGGLYMPMTLDDGDVTRLRRLLDDGSMKGESQQTDFKSDRWQEEGPWLLLLVIPLAALAFRRGVLLSAVLLVFLLPSVQPVSADDGWNWQSLFQNRDQQAAQLLQQGDSEQAAELFSDQRWKAAAHYKAGDYETALQQMETLDSADASYNRANALARLGRLEDALEGYDEALKLDPDNEDAAYNRKLVEEALKQQQQQQQDQSQQGDGEQGDNEQQDQQQQSDQSSEQQGQESQNQQQDQQSGQDATQSEQQDSQDGQEKGEQTDQQQGESEVQQQDEEAAQQSEQTQQDKGSDEESSRQALSQQDQQQTLSEQAEAQWLRRIPDDPGGLLRNKFKYQYGRQRQPNTEQETW